MNQLGLPKPSGSEQTPVLFGQQTTQSISLRRTWLAQGPPPPQFLSDLNPSRPIDLTETNTTEKKAFLSPSVKQESRPGEKDDFQWFPFLNSR